MKKNTINPTIERSRIYFGQRSMKYETHNENNEKISDISLEDWKAKVLKELTKDITGYQYVAVIFHTEDTKTDENNNEVLVEPHAHFVFKYKEGVSVSKMYELTKVSKPKNFSYRNIKEGAVLRYLTHTTNEAMKQGKIRYEVKDLYVISNETDYKSDDFLEYNILKNWYREKIKRNIANEETKKLKQNILKKALKETKESLLEEEEIQQFLYEHFLDEEEAISFYVSNKQKFDNAYKLGLTKRYNKEKVEGREEKQTIYICGSSKVGKTVFAQDLAISFNLKDKRPDHSFYRTPSNSNKKNWDWISNYKTEHVTIFEDLSEYSFDFNHFLQLFDPKLTINESSRYYNKPWFSKYAIITKSTDINDYINHICKDEIEIIKKENNKEEIARKKISNSLYQVQRRFSLILEIKNDMISFYKYEKTDNPLEEAKLLNIKNIKIKNLEDFWYNEKTRNKVIKTIFKNVK